MSDSAKLPVSAIVVCYNEAHLLRTSLASLDFCDELIVVDLGSSDDSVAIAQEFATSVKAHPWVPIGEQTWPAIVSQTRHMWLLRADPDEVFTPELAQRLDETLASVQEKTAAIALPHRHFFLNKPVTKTSWAVKGTHVAKVYRKDSIAMPGYVHGGILIPQGRETLLVTVEPEEMIQHSSVPTLKHYFEKARRYSRLEGQARYDRGERFSMAGMLLMPLRILWRELYIYEAWQDGFVGITIAMLGALYEWLSWLSLWRWQRRTAA